MHSSLLWRTRSAHPSACLHVNPGRPEATQSSTKNRPPHASPLPQHTSNRLIKSCRMRSRRGAQTPCPVSARMAATTSSGAGANGASDRCPLVAGLSTRSNWRNITHLENLRPTVAELAIAYHQTFLPVANCRAHRLHAICAPAWHYHHSTGVIYPFEGARDILHHALKTPGHVIERAVQ